MPHAAGKLPVKKFVSSNLGKQRTRIALMSPYTAKGVFVLFMSSRGAGVLMSSRFNEFYLYEDDNTE